MTGPTVKSLVLAALAVVATGGAGVALGLSGLVSAPTITAGVALSDVRTTTASACIGGPTAAVLDAGDRVVVVQRSDDGDWLGVRSAGRVVWVPADVVTLDDGEPDAAALPVGGVCPEVVIVADAVTPTAEPTTEPNVEPTEEPGGDTTPPTLGTPTATPTLIGCEANIYPTSTTVAVTATDNRGVSSVRISWTGMESGSAQMALGAGVWSYDFNPATEGQGIVTFTIVATDPAGLQSAAKQVSVTVECNG